VQFFCVDTRDPLPSSPGAPSKSFVSCGPRLTLSRLASWFCSPSPPPLVPFRVMFEVGDEREDALGGDVLL